MTIRMFSAGMIFLKRLNVCSKRVWPVPRISRNCFGRADLLIGQNLLPTPPEELGDGWEYKIEYLSPLAKAQRNNELQSINAVLETAGGIAQLMPEVIDNINPDATIREIGDVTGATNRMFRTQEEMTNIREARVAAAEEQEQAAQMQQGLDAAQQVKEIEDDGTKGSSS